MHLIGVARLGRDAEVRFMQDGTPVADLSLAWNYGKKGQDGNRPSQWTNASLWGERAQKLAQYLVKGTQVMVHLSDPHTEEYDKTGGGKGFKLVSRVDHIEFVGGTTQAAARQERGISQPSGGSNGQQTARQQAPQQRPAPQSSSGGGGGFADMDDSIPF
jgi:single-strand DNA-binding protein